MANSIFPFISGDTDLDEEDVVSSSDTLPLYREVAFDFEKSCIIMENNSPKIVEGLEAIKVWVWKAIKTNRFEFDIYSWDYGCEITSLLGKGFTKAFISSEVKRYIKDALLINPYILSIDSIEVSFNKDVLVIETNITTIYGTGNVVV